MALADIKIDAVEAYFGEDKAQVEEVTCVADVGGALGGKYFTLYAGSAKHYVWFDTGSSVDPAVPNATGHSVTIASGDNAGTVASAANSIINALTDFNSTVSGSKITITHTATGYCSEAQDATVSAKKTGFAFKVVVLGDSELSLGYLKGNVEFTKKEEKIDVTAHQTGPTILTSIRTGETMELALVLEETTKSALKRLIARGGGSFTPDASGASEVMGHGTGLFGVNTEAFSSKLRLHPKRLADADKTEDINFWKALPFMETFTYSGEEIFNVPVKFQVLPDTTKPAKINLWYIGDSSQF